MDARQAEAAVRRARAGLDAALAEQHDARGDVARDAPLAQSGALATDAYRQEPLRNDAAVAGVAQTQAALAPAQADRTYTSLVSPTDGVVLPRPIHHRQPVLPGP